jgi:NAD(P)-dependent dehydrogenase (short-subunit alcohol dehydrogenase family)
MQGLVDKVVIVTGAGSGIGAACAERLAAEGAIVVAVDMDGGAVNGVVREITGEGTRISAMTGNVTSEDDVRRIVKDTVAQNGGLDAVVHAAGISRADDTDILKLSTEAFDDTVNVNYKATFLLYREVLPHLIARGGGSLVTISAASHLRGTGGAAYSSSKGAATALTKAIAYQQSKHNVRANVICPGLIDAPMLWRSLKKVGQDTPQFRPGALQRIGTAAELASLATYLVSDDAAFINGAVYAADGGMSQY